MAASCRLAEPSRILFRIQRAFALKGGERFMLLQPSEAEIGLPGRMEVAADTFSALFHPIDGAWPFAERDGLPLFANRRFEARVRHLSGRWCVLLYDRSRPARWEPDFLFRRDEWEILSERHGRLEDLIRRKAHGFFFRELLEEGDCPMLAKAG